MKYRRSLRYRITVAFCLFGIILGLVHSVTVYNALYAVENHIFRRNAELELEHYLERYQRDPETPLPATRFLRGYWGTDKLPDSIREQAASLPEGVHSFWRYQQEPSYKFVVAVKRVQGRAESFYLVFDAGSVEVSNRGFNHMFVAILIGATVLVIGLAALLGFFTARRIILPLVRLADWLAEVRPGHLPNKFSQRCTGDEVGFLAKRLEELMLRVQAFIDRERQFTRNVSHELRTPAAVMKGTIQLLETLPIGQEKSAQRALARGKRAVKDMEDIINAFLCLARESTCEGEPYELLPIVEHALEQHRQLANHKQLTVDIETDGSPTVTAPEAVVYIAVSNLIRNAFLYTEQGGVRIRVSRQGVSVADTGVGISAQDLERVTEARVRGENSQGYGLGLSIVKEFCQRFGWQLQLDSEEGQGTQATLRFTF